MFDYDKANEFIELNKKKKDLQEELDGLEFRIGCIEKDLYTAFEAEQLDEIKTGGYVLRPVLKFTASAKDDKTIRVLRRRGFGELVRPTIHPSTAHAFIRRQADANGGDIPKWIAVNFHITTKETISMRKE
jgi:hypothetical protein